MMFIDDQKKANRLGMLKSPVPLACIALIACAVMLLALIGRPSVPTVAQSPFPSTTVLHAASLIADQRVIFLMLLGGFVLMAGGCFVLSRRSVRDTLTAELRRTR